MAPPSRWRDWKPGEDAPAPAEPFAGFAGASPAGIGETPRSRQVPNQQNQQKGRTPHIGDSPPHQQKASETSRRDGKGANHRASKASETASPPGVDPLDRIAELCVRHHLDQWAGTPVADRLDDLLAAPLDDLAETEAALLRACDYLHVTGDRLDAMNQQADKLAQHHRRRDVGGTNQVGSTP